MRYEHLFTPLSVRGLTLKNRIFSTGHQTCLALHGLPTDDMVAYHEARAAGGTSLITVESARIHRTSWNDWPLLDVSTDDCIPGYAKIAAAVHGHGCALFGQIGHTGRGNKLIHDGVQGVPYSASAAPSEEYKTMPRPLSRDGTAELVEAYGLAAARLVEAGLDGIEVLVSHGTLLAQFLNPHVNQREDEYGGAVENRLRFLAEALESARRHVGDGPVVGIRISGDEKDGEGLRIEDVVEVCRHLDRMDAIDYASVAAGSIARPDGHVHVYPTMAFEAGYVAPLSAAVKAAIGKPVFVAGRINDPSLAERILATGQADLTGMTRAMICDPEMPAKAQAGRLDDIRACVGCNQACVGHLHDGIPISCIQHPETGRERRFGKRTKAKAARRVLVAGGGPAGMKAAAVAAERGHKVTLLESGAQLGGQLRLAQLLPGRMEFGGIIDNLEREALGHGVEVRKRTPLDRALVEREEPDAVIVATGAKPYWPVVEGREEAHVVDAWQVLGDEANVGSRVVVADWRCDWVGLGLAEKLAREGCHVRLAVNGIAAGAYLQDQVRDHWVGVLHELGVEVIPYTRLHGVSEETVFFEHVMTGGPVLCEGTDTLVLSQGHLPVTTLEGELVGWDGEVLFAGDCLSPRTVEEAVYEGMIAGEAVS